MSRYYPVFLDLHRRLAVVLGGGGVALEKVRGLLDAGARVRVVAPHLSEPELRRLAGDGAVEHVPRAYRDGDLEGAFLVLSERFDEDVEAAIESEAARRNVPLNVQDRTPRCSFIAPSIARRGDLTVAISTAGKAPALAARLRREMEERLGEHHARFLDLAASVRDEIRRRHPDFERRRRLWYEVVDSDVLELLRRGEEERARRLMTEITGCSPGEEVHHA